MLLTVSPDLKFLKELPDAPGVYRFYDSDGGLLYVGKAISLIKRVKSYFRISGLSPRITLMVSKINHLEITITDNEASALILENNLIKNAKPKYNILFRDDKSYPYIRVSKHQYPLIEYSRRKPASDALYFGPYPNASAVKETLDLLQRLFKLRTCSNGMFTSRSRPCMLYQVNLCCAPCVGKVTKEEYSDLVRQTTSFLNGDYTNLIDHLSSQMYSAAESLDFERASAIRDRIGMVKQLQDKQIINNSNSPINADVAVCREVSEVCFIYLIFIRNGIYVGDRHFELKVNNHMNVVEAFLEEYYQSQEKVFPVYCQFEISSEFIEFLLFNNKIRIENKLNNQRIYELYLMAQNNLDSIVENYNKNNTYTTGVLKLASLLELDSISRIECYDTSHHHGKNAVTSMVVYQDGNIDSGLYRKFNLSDDVNGDDLLALKQVLGRRFANKSILLPDIILVDGGQLQLQQAKNIIDELGFHDKIKVIAIFKGENRRPELDKVIIRHDLLLDYNADPYLFRLLQTLRDEAHRFAITGHRKKQASKMKHSRLEDIPGIGAQKRKTLIAFFGSVKLVASASIEELCRVKGIGPEMANHIYSYFHS